MGSHNAGGFHAQDTKVAYLAGLIDGDGSFCLSRNLDYYKPFLQIRMTDEHAVRWVHEQFGGRLSTVDPKPSLNRERIFAWAMDNRGQLLALLPELLNFLITKRLQALLMIQFCQKFHYGTGKPYLEQEKLEMTEYAELMRTMNSNGVGSNKRKNLLHEILGETG